MFFKHIELNKTVFEEQMIDFVFGNYNIKLLNYLIPIGYLTLLLYFYDSDKWESFSDIDKIAFTFLSCYIILNFLIVPISTSFELMSNFISYRGEEYLLNPIESVNTYNNYLILFIIVLALLKFVTNEPLCENKDLQKSIFVLIFNYSLILIGLAIYIDIISKSIGYYHYSEYIKPYFTRSALQLFVFLLFYTLIHKDVSQEPIIYYVPFHERVNKSIDKLSNTYTIKRSRVKVGFSAILVLFFIVIGIGFLKPTIIENGEDVRKLTVDELYLDSESNNYAEEELFKYYTIESPFATKWVKVTLNSNLERAFSEINGEYKEYYKNDNYFIVNESSETNVTVVVNEKINISTELDIDKNLPNYTHETEILSAVIRNNLSCRAEIGSIYADFDSSYEPIEYTKKSYREDLVSNYTWKKDDYEFPDRCPVDGNSLCLNGFDLYKNDSVEIIVVFKKI